jgi:hypothetical protein
VEPLLNIAWLMLILPSVLIWRREPKRISPYLHRAQSCVLLCCLLALLFPVVSATDDLCALQRDVEEPVVTKPTVKQSVSAKSAGFESGSRLTAQLSPSDFLWPANEVHSLVSNSQAVAPVEALSKTARGRAPPCRES